MSIKSVARAASRLTPPMAAYYAKRLGRNLIARKWPSGPSRLLFVDETTIPLVGGSEQLPFDLAELIAAYYAVGEEEMQDAENGTFTLLGRRVEFGDVAGINWHHRLPEEGDHHLWRMKLTQLEIVHSLLASGDKRRQNLALDLYSAMTDRVTVHTPDAFETVWAPYGVSHRLLAAISGLTIAEERAPLIESVREKLQALLRRDASFLWRNIEHDLRNNHTERNLAALCVYHMAAGSISTRRSRRLDRDIRRIISATILPDGAQIERSAMYQGLTVMSLRIFASARFLSSATRMLAGERGKAAEGAWLFLTHDDGQLALFNDSWLEEVPQPSAAVSGGGAAIPDSLPNAGYFALRSGATRVLLDAGEIGPRWNPGHGHGDFLAVEVDVAGLRLIVDPGTSQYSTGEQRALERSAAAHNGPVYEAIEPVEYAGRFKVGSLAAARPFPQAALSALPVPAHGGVLATPAGWVARVVAILPSGGILLLDRWQNPTPTGLARFLVPDSWAIDFLDANGLAARRASVDAKIQISTGSIRDASPATWSCRYLELQPASAITAVAALHRAGQGLETVIGTRDPAEVKATVAQIDASIIDLIGRSFNAQ